MIIDTAKEYILCAAIWYETLELKDYEVLKFRGFAPYNVDHGIVFCGWRHPNCMYQMVAITGLTDHEAGHGKQGFLTSHNRFVNRTEAGAIAFTAGQIQAPSSHLYSEDIY